MKKNLVFKRAESIFQLVKHIIETDKYGNIYLNDILNDEYFLKFDENGLYSCLKNLFKDNDGCFIEVRTENDEYSDVKGQFIYFTL